MIIFLMILWSNITLKELPLDSFSQNAAKSVLFLIASQDLAVFSMKPKLKDGRELPMLSMLKVD